MGYTYYPYTSYGQNKYVFADNFIDENHVRCVKIGLVGPNEYGMLLEKIDGTKIYYKYIETTWNEVKWKIISFAPSKAYSIRGSIAHIEICLNPGYEEDYPISIYKGASLPIEIYIGQP
jgi:hypothetical protein